MHPTAAARRRARDEHLASIPWVDRVLDDRPCQGIKWGQVPLISVVKGIPDRARCKLRARWHYEALESQWSKTGDYCIHHLIAQFDRDPREEKRYQEWLAKQPAR